MLAKFYFKTILKQQFGR